MGKSTDNKPVKTVKKVKIRRKRLADKSPKNKIEAILVRDAIVEYVRKNKKAPTAKAIAKELGISYDKVRNYINDLDTNNDTLLKLSKALVPDVVMAIYRRAMSTSTADSKLFLQLTTGFIEPGREKESPTTNILNNGGVINFVSAVPDKSDGKK